MYTNARLFVTQTFAKKTNTKTNDKPGPNIEKMLEEQTQSTMSLMVFTS